MKKEINETPSDKTIEIDGVKCYKLGTINIPQQYGLIPTPSSEKFSKEVDDINSYLLDLHLLIDNTFVKVSMWQLLGSNDTLERYDDEALEMYKEYERLRAKTDEVLAKTAKVYKIDVIREKSILRCVNKCFGAYRKLQKRKIQKVGKDSQTTITGGDLVIGRGGMPILTNTKVMDEYKRSRFEPTNLSSLADELGRLLGKWEIYRGNELEDDGRLEAIFTVAPNEKAILSAKILEYFTVNPKDGDLNPIHRCVATIYITFQNLSYLGKDIKVIEFVRRLNKTFGYSVDASNIRKAISAKDYGGLKELKGNIDHERKFFSIK